MRRTIFSVAILAFCLLGLRGANQIQPLKTAPPPKAEQYEQAAQRLRDGLPSHSGIPPTLDLSQPSSASSAASPQWEKRFNGGAGRITDPGVPTSYDFTSTGLTSDELVGRIYALPAKSDDAMVIADVVSSAAHLTRRHLFVYSTFSLQVSQILKQDRKHLIRTGETITAAQFGGRLLFPSGQLETFLWANEGFLDLQKQSVVFIWRPIPSDPTYMVSEAYAIEDGLVFPIHAMTDESTYAGMPIDKFEAKVKDAIARNVDQ